jgi:hypothetical protein
MIKRGEDNLSANATQLQLFFAAPSGPATARGKKARGSGVSEAKRGKGEKERSLKRIRKEIDRLPAIILTWVQSGGKGSREGWTGGKVSALLRMKRVWRPFCADDKY